MNSSDIHHIKQHMSICDLDLHNSYQLYLQIEINPRFCVCVCWGGVELH